MTQLEYELLMLAVKFGGLFFIVLTICAVGLYLLGPEDDDD